MKKIAVFKHGNSRAINLPQALGFDRINKLEIAREGNTIILRPVKPDWASFLQEQKSDADFMTEREDVIANDRCFNQ